MKVNSAVLVFVLIFIISVFSGCVSNKGAREVRVSVPALFEFRTEYYENQDSDLSIGSKKENNSQNEEK